MTALLIYRLEIVPEIHACFNFHVNICALYIPNKIERSLCMDCNQISIKAGTHCVWWCILFLGPCPPFDTSLWITTSTLRTCTSNLNAVPDYNVMKEWSIKIIFHFYTLWRQCLEQCKDERYNTSMQRPIGKTVFCKGVRFSRTQVMTCASAALCKKVDICQSEPIVYNVYFQSVTQSVPTRGKQKYRLTAMGIEAVTFKLTCPPSSFKHKAKLFFKILPCEYPRSNIREKQTYT